MMFHGYVRLPESKWFSRKNIIIWVKLYKASGNFIRQQKNTSSTGQCWEIYHASPRPNRETPLKVQCTISQVSSFPTWSLHFFFQVSSKANLIIWGISWPTEVLWEQVVPSRCPYSKILSFFLVDILALLMPFSPSELFFFWWTY